MSAPSPDVPDNKRKSKGPTTPRDKLAHMKSLTSAAAQRAKASASRRSRVFDDKKSKSDDGHRNEELLVAPLVVVESPAKEERRKKRKKKKKTLVSSLKFSEFSDTQLTIKRTLSNPPEFKNIDRSQYPYEIYQRLQSNLLDAVGVDKSTRKKIEALLLNSYEMTTMKNAHMCSLESLQSIEAMARDIAMYSSFQYGNQAALAIQTQMRGFLSRKLYQHVKDTINHNKIKSFHALIKREKQYVINLATVVSQYIMPLRITTNKQLRLIDKELVKIFSNIESIMELHREFLQSLIDLADRSWPQLLGLGDLLISISPRWRSYGTYVNNFKLARDLLLECTEQNEAFRDFLDEQTMKLSLDLNMLLSQPLNHIAGYELTLKPILEETEQPEETSALLQALQIASETSKFIANALGKADNIANVERVKRSFAELPPVLVAELAKPNLQYVSEIAVDILPFGGKKAVPAYLILMQTIAILAVQTKGGLQLRHCYKLGETTVEPSDVDPLCFSMLVIDEEAPAYDNVVGGTRYEIFVDSANRRDNWVQEIRNLISRNQRSRTFGVPLEHLVEREKPEGDIPTVVRQLIEYLDDEGLDTLGLFRIPGTSTVVKRLRMAYNQSFVTGVFPVLKDMEDFRPNDAAGLLKMFFHDLPEPLIPYQMYHKFCENQSGDLSYEDMVQELRYLVHSLPTVNFHILEFLVRFMVRVVDHREENKMGPENLAMCFGPNVIRPEEQTIESTLSIPKTNGCIARMIEQFDYIFAPVVSDNV